MKEENRVADLALEAAARALSTSVFAPGPYEGWQEDVARIVVAAYLDALRGGLEDSE